MGDLSRCLGGSSAGTCTGNVAGTRVNPVANYRYRYYGAGELSRWMTYRWTVSVNHVGELSM